MREMAKNIITYTAEHLKVVNKYNELLGMDIERYPIAIQDILLKICSCVREEDWNVEKKENLKKIVQIILKTDLMSFKVYENLKDFKKISFARDIANKVLIKKDKFILELSKLIEKHNISLYKEDSKLPLVMRYHQHFLMLKSALKKIKEDSKKIPLKKEILKFQNLIEKECNKNKNYINIRMSNKDKTLSFDKEIILPTEEQAHPLLLEQYTADVINLIDYEIKDIVPPRFNQKTLKEYLFFKDRETLAYVKARSVEGLTALLPFLHFQMDALYEEALLFCARHQDIKNPLKAIQKSNTIEERQLCTFAYLNKHKININILERSVVRKLLEIAQLDEKTIIPVVKLVRIVLHHRHNETQYEHINNFLKETGQNAIQLLLKLAKTKNNDISTIVDLVQYIERRKKNGFFMGSHPGEYEKNLFSMLNRSIALCLSNKNIKQLQLSVRGEVVKKLLSKNVSRCIADEFKHSYYEIYGDYTNFSKPGLIQHALSSLRVSWAISYLLKKNDFELIAQIIKNPGFLKNLKNYRGNEEDLKQQLRYMRRCYGFIKKSHNISPAFFPLDKKSIHFQKNIYDAFSSVSKFSSKKLFKSLTRLVERISYARLVDLSTIILEIKELKLLENEKVNLLENLLENLLHSRNISQIPIILNGISRQRSGQKVETLKTIVRYYKLFQQIENITPDKISCVIKLIINQNSDNPNQENLNFRQLLFAVEKLMNYIEIKKEGSSERQRNASIAAKAILDKVIETLPSTDDTVKNCDNFSTVLNDMDDLVEQMQKKSRKGLMLFSPIKAIPIFIHNKIMACCAGKWHYFRTSGEILIEEIKDYGITDYADQIVKPPLK